METLELLQELHRLTDDERRSLLAWLCGAAPAEVEAALRHLVDFGPRPRLL